jgi:hypothetical protein
MLVRFALFCFVPTCIAAGAALGSGCTGASKALAPDGGDGAAMPSDSAVDVSDDGFAATDAGDMSDSDGGVAPDAGRCHPGSATGFQPPTVAPPAYAPSLACNGFNDDGGLVASYGAACLGHASTYESCAAFAAPDAAGASACYRCLTTTESPDASAYGAVAVVTVPFVNYGGCAQLLDPTDAGASCALVATAAAFCSEYVCKPSCPITDQASFNEYMACWNAANAGPCIGYWLGMVSCLQAEQGDGGTPVANVCFGGQTAEDHYRSFASYLCGGS